MRSLAFASIVLLAALLAGERIGRADAQPLPQLRVRWYAYPLCNLMSTYIANNFKSANVTVYCAPGSSFYSGAISDIRSDNPSFDIWIFDLNWLSDAHGPNLDGLTDMTSWLISDDLNYGDFYDAALKAVEFPPDSGRYIAAPFIPDVPLLVYRKSAFAKYNLTLPSTLEGLANLAEFFKQQPEYANGTGLAFRWCTDRTATRCRTSTINSYSANSILFSYGTSLWNSDTYKIKGVLDKPKTFDAVRFTKRLYDTGSWAGRTTVPEDSHGYVDAAYQFCNGLSPMYADFGSLAASVMAYPYCKNATSDIGFYSIPYSAVNNKDGLQMAGMSMALSPKTPEPEIAKEFMKFMVSREVQLFLGKNGGYTVRKSVAADPSFALDNNGNVMFNNIGFIQSVQRGQPMWKVWVRKDLADLHEEYLSRALIGTMTVEDAVTTLATAQQQVLDAAFPCGPKCPIPHKRPQALFDALEALAIICAIVYGVALIAVVILRMKPVLRASSPTFLGLTIGGAIMMIISFILRAQENPSSQRCLGISWLELLGIATLFGALISKTYRIAAIFGMKKVNVIVLPDSKLLRLFFAIVLLFCAFLIAWTAVDAPYAETVIRKLEDGNLEQEIQCTEGRFGVYSLLLQILLLLCGSVLAFQVRNAPSAFHEAKYIAIGIYNFALVTGVLLLVHQSGADSDILFVFQGIHIMGSTLVILGLLLVPKFIGVYHGVTNVSGDSSDTTQTSDRKGPVSTMPGSCKTRPSEISTGSTSPRNKAASTSSSKFSFKAGSVDSSAIELTSPEPISPAHLVLSVSADGTVDYPKAVGSEQIPCVTPSTKDQENSPLAAVNEE